MPTFAELKAKVSRKLIDPNNVAVDISDVGDAINDAIRFWRYRRFWFNEVAASVVMTVGSNLIDISGLADFLYEMPKAGFVIQYNNQSYPLTKVEPVVYDEANSGGTGLPYLYTWRNGQYLCQWAADQPYNLSVYYFKDYAALVNDADTNDFTLQADQLVIYEALSRLSGEDRQDLEMNNSYAAKADREYTSLANRTFKQTGSGRLSVNSILSG